jgi:hypothetical protein
MQEVLERSGGKVRLWPATLYGSLKRLIKNGLIVESGDRREPAAQGSGSNSRSAPTGGSLVSPWERGCRRVYRLVARAFRDFRLICGDGLEQLGEDVTLLVCSNRARQA